MIIDITGITLIPGNKGQDCPGNGEHFDEYGNLLEICCDECDYYICCITENIFEQCKYCNDKKCPHAKNGN